jgi:hypothetical protein
MPVLWTRKHGREFLRLVRGSPQRHLGRDGAVYRIFFSATSQFYIQRG